MSSKEAADIDMTPKAIAILSGIVARFHVSAAYYMPRLQKLAVITASSQNEILSFFERENAFLRAGVRLQVLPPSAQKNEAIPEAFFEEHVITLYLSSSRGLAKSQMRSRTIIEFDTSKLATKEKIRFYQRLYGFEKKGRSGIKNKQPISTGQRARGQNQSHLGNTVQVISAIAPRYFYEGFLQKIGGEKIGRSAIMIDSVFLQDAEAFFAASGVITSLREVYTK